MKTRVSVARNICIAAWMDNRAMLWSTMDKLRILRRHQHLSRRILDAYIDELLAQLEDGDKEIREKLDGVCFDEQLELKIA